MLTQTWPSDRVQAVAYAMMLEEATGKPVPEARVRYHKDGVTVRVLIDEDRRAAVGAALDRARKLRLELNRPPITDNEKLCRRCSLAPVCLLEEVRQEHDPDHQAVRLFPPDDRRASLHVVTEGTAVGRGGDRLIVRPLEGAESKHATLEVSAVLLHGSLHYAGRSRRPTLDRFSAILNFGYALLQTAVMRALLTTGLEPALPRLPKKMATPVRRRR